MQQALNLSAGVIIPDHYTEFENKFWCYLRFKEIDGIGWIVQIDVNLQFSNIDADTVVGVFCRLGCDLVKEFRCYLILFPIGWLSMALSFLSHETENDKILLRLIYD